MNVTQWVPPGCGARASSLMYALYHDEAARVAQEVGFDVRHDLASSLAFRNGYIQPLVGYDRERAIEALRLMGIKLP